MKPLDIFYITYLALTQSIFVPFFGIFIFYIASKVLYSPKKNWYYPEDTKDNS